MPRTRKPKPDAEGSYLNSYRSGEMTANDVFKHLNDRAIDLLKMDDEDEEHHKRALLAKDRREYIEFLLGYLDEVVSDLQDAVLDLKAREE